LGITGKDFALIAASKAAMRGATILKATDDKTRQLNKHTLVAFSGEAGDTGACSAFPNIPTRPAG
jgi:20S proteasome subunit beta 4